MLPLDIFTLPNHEVSIRVEMRFTDQIQANVLSMHKSIHLELRFEDRRVIIKASNDLVANGYELHFRVLQIELYAYNEIVFQGTIDDVSSRSTLLNTATRRQALVLGMCSSTSCAACACMCP